MGGGVGSAPATLRTEGGGSSGAGSTASSTAPRAASATAACGRAHHVCSHTASDLCAIASRPIQRLSQEHMQAPWDISPFLFT